jgi:hypothetical protein
MTKKLLITTAVIEAAAGVTFLAMPLPLVSILIGAEFDTSADLVVARVAGAALLSLGVACGFGSRDAKSRAATGIVAAMLLYNLSAVVLFLSARYGSGLTGIGLLPATAVHAGLAVWCVICLGSARCDAGSPNDLD